LFGLRAYDGSGPKAKVVGEAADCEARDPATRLVTLNKGTETQVPVRIQDDFTGANVEFAQPTRRRELFSIA